MNGNPFTNPAITIARQPHLLERYDFSVLKKTESLWFNLGFTFVGASVGLFINMLAKLLGSKIDSTIKFDSWEVFAWLIATGLAGCCFLINLWVPNEKRRIVEKINKHFEKQ